MDKRMGLLVLLLVFIFSVVIVACGEKATEVNQGQETVIAQDSQVEEQEREGEEEALSSAEEPVTKDDEKVVLLKAEDIFQKVILDADPDYFLIDLRDRDDFLEASIAGAISIPYEICDKEEILARLPFDKKIVIIDYDGVLADEVAATWHGLGYDVGFLVDGMEGWLVSASGEKYPTVKTELSTAAGSGCN